MKAKPLPPLEYLHECLELTEDSPSGIRWRKRPSEHFKNTGRQWNGKWSGKNAGTVKPTASERLCWILRLGGKMYQVHRIVYAMFNNCVIPDDIEIDHVDTNALNNTPSNLRVSSHADNANNTKLRRDSTSGFKGVSWSKTGKYWWGEVVCKGKRFRVRGYQSAKDCADALKKVREEQHKEFANHG